MTKFEEPILDVIKFKSEDTILTASYNIAGSDDNSYINEDEYNREGNPWE